MATPRPFHMIWRHLLNPEFWKFAGKTLLENMGPPALGIVLGQFAEYAWELMRPGHGVWINLMCTYVGMWIPMEKMVVSMVRDRRRHKRWKQLMAEADRLWTAGRHEEALELMKEVRDDTTEASKR